MSGQPKDYRCDNGESMIPAASSTRSRYVVGLVRVHQFDAMTFNLTLSLRVEQ